MVALVGVALVSDWTENVLLLRRLDVWWQALDDNGVLRQGDLGLTWVRIAGWVKWIALAVVILGAVLVFAVRQLARAGLALLRAMPRLWLQMLIVALFTLAVAVPDQSADAIRRLSVGQWVFTLVVLAVFAFVMLATALGALHPSSARPAKAVSEVVWSGLPVLGLGVVVMVLARVTPFRGLLVPGLIIAVVGFVSLVIDVLARRDSGARVMLERADIEAQPDAAPQPPPQPQRATARRRVAAALAVAPLAAFGVAAVRGSAGDVAMIGAGPGGRVAGRLIAGCVLTIAAGALVLPVNALGKRLLRLDDRSRLVILGLLVAVHAPGMLMHDPDVNVAHAHQVGALALLMVFLSGFALLPTAAAWLAYLLMRFRYSRPFAVPSAVRIMRFQSTPVLGLLTLWALLAGVVPDRSYHDMRRVEAAGDAPSTPPPSLDSIVSGWFARQAGTGAVPALFVASSGGGIRAGYWTAAVLDCIVERDGPSIDPCARPADPGVVAARRRALMMMSGISGGSLGLATYVTAVGAQWGSDDAGVAPLDAGWYDQRLGDDYLAPDVAAWLFNDGINALLRPGHGVDRAAVMERAWEASWDNDDLAAGFLAGQRSGGQPLLLLNGYNVEDGCRVNTSVLAAAHGAAVSTCRAVPNGQLSLLRSTADLASQLCPGEDIRVSTAALNSARFPFVSPSGHVAGCTEPRRPGDRNVPPDLELVDGGYRETSGASPLVELWPSLVPLFTDAGHDRCAAPLFLQIDNGYASDQVSTSGRSVVGQFVVPLVAISNTPGGVESAARQASLDMLNRYYGRDTRGVQWFRITTFAHPGSSAPLGWVLSDDARADLKRQLVLNGDVIAAVRLRLANPTACQAT